MQPRGLEKWACDLTAWGLNLWTSQENVQEENGPLLLKPYCLLSGSSVGSPDKESKIRAKYKHAVLWWSDNDAHPGRNLVDLDYHVQGGSFSSFVA